MKNTILLFAFLLISVTQLSAQEKVYERRGSCIHVELLGNGIGFSINYESRFTKSHRGIGGRVGLSTFKVGGKQSLILPVLINYTLGKKEGKHHLEVGAGITYLSEAGAKITSNDKDIFFVDNTYATFTLMYRYQPPFGGFLFKFGLTPFVGTFQGQDSPIFTSIGIAFGYAF